MDIQPQSAQAISDDQELAKVLAGVNQETDQALEFEQTPVTTPTADITTPTAPADTPVVDPAPVATPDPTPAPAFTMPVMPSAASDDLESIKKNALQELRPLVDKLDINPEEKFDTYLLLLRSTDDKALISPAYAAAQAITDEARKAQALLDVIKEIDYLSTPKQ